MTLSRRFLLLLLTVSCLGLSVPSAWAAFTSRTARAAVATFSTATLAAPVVATAQRCAVSQTVVVTWTHSTSSFVTSQLVELSSSPTLATTTQTATLADNSTQTKTFLSISVLTTYYVRVTAKFQSWSTPSGILVATPNLSC